MKYCMYVGNGNDFVSTIAGDSEYHETRCVGKLISFSFHVYEERPNRRSYVSCTLI
jgi:hypothetical protein